MQDYVKRLLSFVDNCCLGHVTYVTVCPSFDTKDDLVDFMERKKKHHGFSSNWLVM